MPWATIGTNGGPSGIVGRSLSDRRSRYAIAVCFDGRQPFERCEGEQADQRDENTL